MSPKTATKAAKAASPVEGFVPELVALLEAGVHFGHERSKRNPKMEPFIFTQRNRVAILDLEQTREQLIKAADFAHEIASKPASNILFVGTKRQARPIIQKYAEATEQPFITKRWLGGTLTNFSTILKSIEKLEELKRTEDSPSVANLTKKEKAVRAKEIERLEEVLEGIRTLKSLPSALFLASAHNERIAIREARRVGVPIIGIADTNADPEQLDYPISANDDALRSIEIITQAIAQSIASARGINLKV